VSVLPVVVARVRPRRIGLLPDLQLLRRAFPQRELPKRPDRVEGVVLVVVLADALYDPGLRHDAHLKSV